MADELESEIGMRLEAVMAEFQAPHNKDLGDLCGTTHNAVNNWRHGYNLPRVPQMIRLCEHTGITLDWLYRGFVGTMDPKLASRLNRRMH